MDTSCSALIVPTFRPWWRRAWHDLVDRLAAARRPDPIRSLPDDEFAALGGLSAGTLRDIGAPEWLRERAELQRQRVLAPLRW